MPISEKARDVFNGLPANGDKLSGKTIKDRFNLKDVEWKKVKDELKAEKLVVLGRGRGGTIGRLEGSEAPAEEKIKTKEESLEVAREVKAAKNREQKRWDKTKDAVLAAGRRLHPDHDKLIVGFYNGDYYVEVWKDNVATTQFISEWEWEEDDVRS